MTIGTTETIELPSLTGVAAGETASQNLEPTRVYGALVLDYRRGTTPATLAQIRADITRVRVAADADTIVDCSGADLLHLAAHYALTPGQDGQVLIPFARPYFTDQPREDYFAIGTRYLRALSLQVDIAAGAQSPKLKAYALVYHQPNRASAAWMRINKNAGYQAQSIGPLEISDLPIVGPQTGLAALHIDSPGTLNKLSLRVSGRLEYEAAEAVAEALMRFQTMRSRRAAAFDGHWVIDWGNRLSGIRQMQTIADVRLIADVSRARAITVLHETVKVNPDAERQTARAA